MSRNVYGYEITMEAHQLFDTPYGGRLEWTLPGGNPLIVHLKDKTKIRHKKRWSQVNVGHNVTHNPYYL